MKQTALAIAAFIAVFHNQSAFETHYKHYPVQPPVTINAPHGGHR